MTTKTKAAGMPELTQQQREELLRLKPQLLALHEEVLAARLELMGSAGDGLSDFEFTQLIRLTHPSTEHEPANLLERIEADRAAIKRALAGGGWDFASRLASLQRKYGGPAADQRNAGQ